MPYIKKDARKFLTPKSAPLNAGELNFAITALCIEYLQARKEHNGEWRYQELNDVLGALEGAKLEFYRRVAVPYEQKKIRENGDVYPE